METMILTKNARDLTGQRFGRLVAERPLRSTGKGIVWFCRCDCGGCKEVLSSALVKKKTQSCGCIRQEAKERQDITGKRFGRLVAVELDHCDEKSGDCWLFHCDCGAEKIMPAANVKYGRVKSCGCLYRERMAKQSQDITGRRYGRLVASKPTQERDTTGSVIWECHCDCGNSVNYSVSRLERGTTLSCGCLYRESRSIGSDNRRDTVEGTMLSALISAKELRTDNSSGHTGVCFDKKTQKWQAYINFQKKRHNLGFYSTKEQAIRAREEAEEKLHDPLIRDQWDRLTEQSKTKFLAVANSAGKA